MGNSSSITSVTNFTRSVLSILNDSTQQSATFASDSQDLNLSDNTGKIVIGKIIWKEYATVDVAAAQNAAASAKTQNQINQEIQAMAKATNQALSLNPGSTKSKTILDNITNLATNITNAYTQQCVAQVVNTQSINAQNNSGTMKVKLIKFTQFAKSTADCTQKSSSVTKASQQLSQSIKASSTSTVQFLGDFGWIIALVLVAFFVMLGGGMSKLLEPRVMFTIACLLSAYFAVASTWEGKPYVKIPKTWSASPGTAPGASPSDNGLTQSDYDKDVKRNKTILTAAVGATGLFGVLAVIAAQGHSKSKVSPVAPKSS